MSRKRSRSVETDATLTETEHPEGTTTRGPNSSPVSHHDHDGRLEVRVRIAQNPEAGSSRSDPPEAQPATSTPVETDVHADAASTGSHTISPDSEAAEVPAGPSRTPRRVIQRRRPTKSSRDEFPNSNTPWTYEQNVVLIQMRNAGYQHRDVSQVLGRTQGALRLQKLYLTEVPDWRWHQRQHDRGAQWKSKGVTDAQREDYAQYVKSLPPLCPESGCVSSGQTTPRKAKPRSQGAGRAPPPSQAGPSSRGGKRRRSSGTGNSTSPQETARDTVAERSSQSSSSSSKKQRRSRTTDKGSESSQAGPSSRRSTHQGLTQQNAAPQPFTHVGHAAGLQGSRELSAGSEQVRPRNLYAWEILLAACESSSAEGFPLSATTAPRSIQLEPARGPAVRAHIDTRESPSASGRIESIYSPTDRNGAYHTGRYAGPWASLNNFDHPSSNLSHRDRTYSAPNAYDSEVISSSTGGPYRRSTFPEAVPRPHLPSISFMLNGPSESDRDRYINGRFRNYRWPNGERQPEPRDLTLPPPAIPEFRPDANSPDREHLDRLAGYARSHGRNDSGYQSISEGKRPMRDPEEYSEY